MRFVGQSKAFKRDLKRVEKSRYNYIFDEELWEVVDILANDGLLSYSYHDHPLIGKWADYRECHIAPNLLLVYKYEGDDKLILHRLGTHSEVLGL